MLDAWQILVGNSTAPAGSDAWTHLNNQQGGGVVEGDIIVSELISVDIQDGVEMTDFNVDVLTVNLDLEVITLDAPEAITTEIDKDLEIAEDDGCSC